MSPAEVRATLAFRRCLLPSTLPRPTTTTTTTTTSTDGARLAVVGVVPLDAGDLLFLGALLLGHRWRHLRISEEEEDGGSHGSRCLRSTADLPSARGRSRTCAGATAATV